MSNSRGVCIDKTISLSSKYMQKKDSGKNSLALDLSIEDNRVTLINIYDPNIDSPQFYENVRNVFLESDYDDFNLALNPSQDAYNFCSILTLRIVAKF